MQLRVDIGCTLKDFSLTVQFQTLTRLAGLFGPSGAGKSTLLNALAGLVTPKSGRIVMEDQVVFDARHGINLPPEKRPVGVVFQDARLFPHMNVRRNLEFALGLTPRAQRVVSLDRVIEVLDLSALLYLHVGHLSGGQCQRVALGRTLLTCPKLLLLDEPLSALDMNSKQEILPLLHRVQQAFGMDMLIVSHSLTDLLLLTDSLLLLERGRLVGAGSAGELMRENRLTELAGYTGIPNILTLRVSRHDPVGGLTEYAPERGRLNGSIRGTLRRDLPVGTSVRAVLSPDEIALALAPVETLSMQNRLCGRIRELIPGRDGVYCRVDVGFDLWSRLTPMAIKQLALGPGKKVWCLFKTFAFDLMEVGTRCPDSACKKGSGYEAIPLSAACAF